MLAKLIKHEFNSVNKLLLLLHCMLIFITLAECIGFAIFDFNLDDSPAAFLMLVIYFVFLLAISFSTFIYLIVRFYKNLFTDEGYLTFTLPVKPYMIILSKLAVGFVWGILDLFFSILSIFLVLKSSNVIPNNLNLSLTLGLTAFNIPLDSNMPKLAFYLITIFAISIIYLLLTGYFCICIGQLFSKHKILGAFLTYIIVYIFEQLITSLLFIGFGLFDMIPDIAENSVSQYFYFLTILKISGIESIVLSLICFFVSTYIISKKLNLE